MKTKLKIERHLIERPLLLVNLAIVAVCLLSTITTYAESQAEELKLSSVTKENVISVKVEVPEPSVSEAGGYHHVAIEGLASIGNPGEPELPALGVTVLIPAGKRIKFTGSILSEKRDLDGAYNLEPVELRVPLSPEDEAVLKERIYNSSEPHPAEKIKLVTTQEMRGYRIALFNLFPVEYIPLEGKLSYYKNLTLKVYLEDEEELTVSPFFRNLPEDIIRLEQVIVNPQDIASYEVLTIPDSGAEQQSGADGAQQQEGALDMQPQEGAQETEGPDNE